MQRKLLVLAASLAAGCLGDARLVATEERELALGAAEGLRFEVGDGDLEILGDPGADAIAVTVLLRTHRLTDDGDEAAREALSVVLEPDGDEAFLSVAIDGVDGYFADVSVTLPPGLAVRGSDGTGDVRVEGVARLALADDSGDVLVRDVQGAVFVDDASGDLDLRRTGPVTVLDGSGDLDLAEFEGDVEIEDASGEVRVRDGSGDVDILDDSGGIEVRRVLGAVTIRDGSGDIDVAEVTSFVLVEDGSGDVQHR